MNKTHPHIYTSSNIALSAYAVSEEELAAAIRDEDFPEARRLIAYQHTLYAQIVELIRAEGLKSYTAFGSPADKVDFALAARHLSGPGNTDHVDYLADQKFERDEAVEHIDADDADEDSATTTFTVLSTSPIGWEVYDVVEAIGPITAVADALYDIGGREASEEAAENFGSEHLGDLGWSDYLVVAGAHKYLAEKLNSWIKDEDTSGDDPRNLLTALDIDFWAVGPNL